MVIKSALEELETATAPVAKIVHSDAYCRAIVLAFKKGMALKEHNTNKPTTLLVLEGEIEYSTGQETVIMHKYNQMGIPPGVLHAITALEKSICLLIQG